MGNFDKNFNRMQTVFWIIFAIAAVVIFAGLILSVWAIFDPELIGTWFGKVIASFRAASGI